MTNTEKKKRKQLGMTPGAANHSLTRDLLYNYIVKTGDNICFHCGEPMDRDTFSTEHKEPWLDSDDPVGMYFDLNNIAFSHQKCNASAARREIFYKTEEEKHEAKKRYQRKHRALHYSSEKRRETYLRTGK